MVFAVSFLNRSACMSCRFERLRCVVANAVVLLAVVNGRPAMGEDWPRWRGPRLDGISQETQLLREWPSGGPAQLRKAKLSGGFSSVVVADGRLFTQTKE